MSAAGPDSRTVASAGASASLALETFGGVGLKRGNVTVLAAGKPLAMITYLALSPGRTASREFLLDLLWADLDHDRARHALRQTIWQLRQILGDSCLTGREELRLGISIDADRDRFLRALEAGDPEAAVDLYHGPFLPDFALPGSTDFEHWAENERNRLRAAFLRAAEMVVRRRLSSARFREAQDLARRMRDTSRLNEIGWRLLLEALIANHDTVQAAIEADSLRAMLSAEDRDPEPATETVLAILERARGDLSSAPSDPGDDLVPELVGREREFALVLDVWGQTSRGAARHLHVSASAGLGKTRLLTDVARRLRTLGAKVVYLRANPGDRSIPYGCAGDLGAALGSLPGLPAISPASADVLVALSPSLSSRFSAAKAHTSTGAELLRLRTAAVAEAIAVVAEEHPIALLIDDVHWLDAESHQLLDGVLHRLERVPVMIITAGRPGVGRSFDHPGTVIVELEPLLPAAITALFLSLGRLPDGALLTSIVDRLHHAAGGSPFRILEALQLALDRKTLSLRDGEWWTPDHRILLTELEEGGALRARVGQLGHDERWILLLLATAGTPLTGLEISAGVRAPDRLEDELHGLERRGLIRRIGSSWEPGHDEISATVIESEAGDRRKAAHTVVGRSLLAHATESIDRVIHAGRHLVLGQDEGQIRMAFRRVVQVADQIRDRRSRVVLAADIIGSAANAPTPRSLVRSLPLRVRLRVDSPFRTALAVAVSAVVVSSVAFALSALSPADPDVLALLQWNDAGGSPVRRELALSENRWVSGRRIDPSSGPAWRLAAPVPPNVNGLGTSASGRDWVAWASVDNRLTTEVFLGNAQGATPIASAPRDDQARSFSPDERFLVFETARWTPVGDDDSDLAIYEIATSQLRQLTTGRAYDATAFWSPEGSRIAFLRRHFDNRPSELCWTTIDGGIVRCRSTASTVEPGYLIGWLDHQEILLEADRRDGRHLAALNFDSGRFRWVDERLVSSASMSPDGRWIACVCANAEIERSELILYPSDEPRRAATVEVSGERPQVIGWRVPSPRKLGIETITISGVDTLRLGASSHLVAIGHDPMGRMIPLSDSVLRWRSSDAATMSIDSTTGLATPLRPGTVEVTVSVGGWRNGSRRLAIGAASATTVMTERWTSLDSAWRSFGMPKPTLTEGPGGIGGLINNGDGSYPSGVYSTRAFDADDGLGLEALVSLPITWDHWQSQSIHLLADSAIGAYSRWDHATSEPPTARRAVQCGFGYPGSEGRFGNARAFLGTDASWTTVPVDSTFGDSGVWHRVRIQILPDRTCGIAIDGMPRWRSKSRLAPGNRYRIMLSGNTAKTRIVVGPLDVWRGARDDVDWDFTKIR